MKEYLDRKIVLAVVIIALLVGGPFLHKPFHMDDPVVLQVAKQILQEPLNPFNTRINWENDPVPLIDITKSPPLLSYYLAPCIALFGCSEVALHSAMLLFLIMLGTALALLGQRFGVGAWWPLFLVMFTPAVMVSGNVMRDVPALAFSTLGLAWFIIGVDEDHRGLLISGSVLLGLAALTKYSATSLIPLMVLYPILQGKRPYAVWSLVPLAFLGLWLLQTWLAQGQSHILVLLQQRAAARAGSVQPWGGKFIAALVIIGSTLFLPPVVLAVWLRRRAWIRLGATVLTGLAAVVAVCWYFSSGSHLSWQYYLFAAMGAALLVAALTGAPALSGPRSSAASERRRDRLFLGTWIVFPLLFSLTLTPFQAVRHLLYVLPPLVILGVQVLGPRGKLATTLLALILVGQTAVAYLVAAADYEMADSHRRFARYAAEKYQGPGQQIWFNGHWGWSYYALAQGFHQVSRHGPQPPPGALVLDPAIVGHSTYPPGLNLKLVEEKRYPARLPVRTIDAGNCCFYAMFRSLLPYYFTSTPKPLQVGRIYRVVPHKFHEAGGWREKNDFR